MKAILKTFIFFSVTLLVIVGSISIAVFHHEDGDERVAFTLDNHDGNQVTEKALSGQHLLVFFGFTSCPDICPIQMSKLTRVMNILEVTGHASLIKPVFITIDPERDSSSRIKSYLASFHEDFVGLTGTRKELEAATTEFKTYLQDAPNNHDMHGLDYAVTHSSAVYIVDPFSRLVSHISVDSDAVEISNHVKGLL